MGQRNWRSLTNNTKKKCAAGSEISLELTDLPDEGNYFVQLHTGTHKTYNVRGKIDVIEGSVASKDSEWAELIYAPIIPNEWTKNTKFQTMLMIDVTYHPDEKKKRELFFKVTD